MTLVRLPSVLKQVFSERVEKALPLRAKRILNNIIETKGGVMNRSAFGDRMVGQGERWQAIEWLFRQSCENLGINQEVARPGRGDAIKSTFQRPQAQLSFTF
jgi:hypothetical protein